MTERFVRIHVGSTADGVASGEEGLPVHISQGVPGKAGPVDGANGLPIEDAAMVKQLTRISNGIAMILGVKPGDLDG